MYYMLFGFNLPVYSIIGFVIVMIAWILLINTLVKSYKRGNSINNNIFKTEKSFDSHAR